MPDSFCSPLSSGCLCESLGLGLGFEVGVAKEREERVDLSTNLRDDAREIERNVRDSMEVVEGTEAQCRAEN